MPRSHSGTTGTAAGTARAGRRGEGGKNRRLRRGPQQRDVDQTRAAARAGPHSPRARPRHVTRGASKPSCGTSGWRWGSFRAGASCGQQDGQLTSSRRGLKVAAPAFAVPPRRGAAAVTRAVRDGHSHTHRATRGVRNCRVWVARPQRNVRAAGLLPSLPSLHAPRTGARAERASASSSVTLLDVVSASAARLHAATSAVRGLVFPQSVLDPREARAAAAAAAMLPRYPSVRYRRSPLARVALAMTHRSRSRTHSGPGPAARLPRAVRNCVA